MPVLIEKPTGIQAAGNKPKRIEEFIARPSANVARVLQVLLVFVLVSAQSLAADLDLEIIGQFFTGRSYAVEVSGDYAYVANGRSGLWIIDLNNPAQPKLLSSISAGGLALDLALKGNHAYVAAGTAGLQIFDISNPSFPVCVAVLEHAGKGEAYRIQISGDYAYLASREGGLEIIRIVDPLQPVRLGKFLPDNFEISALSVSGHLAFLVEAGVGIHIVDVSDPSAPRLLSRYVSKWNNVGVLTSGSLAFLTVTQEGTHVIDVADPRQPKKIGLISAGSDRLALRENILFAGLTMTDISNLADPRFLGPAGLVIDAEFADLAFWNDKVVYLTKTAGLHILDVADRRNPSRLGGYPTSGRGGDVAVSGTIACLADGPAGMQILDVQDPRNPRRLGSYQFGGWDSLNEARGVDLSGSHAYLACLSELRVLDISNPAATRQVAIYKPGNAVLDVAVSGQYLYAAVDRGGLHILDVSNPAQPVFVASPPLTAGSAPGSAFRNAYNVTLNGHYAYVAYNEGGMQIVDISDPPHARNIGGYAHPLSATYGVAVSGGLACLAEARFGLQIIDLSNPADPKRLGGFDPQSWGGGVATRVAIAGPKAYVADDRGGVVVVDISIPATPRKIGNYVSSGEPGTTLSMEESSSHALGIILSGGLAYVADAWAGLQIFDITTPAKPDRSRSIPSGLFTLRFAQAESAVCVLAANPFQSSFDIRMVDPQAPGGAATLGVYSAYGSASSLVYSNQFVYVAANSGGLLILDAKNPANLRLVGTLKSSDGVYGVSVSGDYILTAEGEIGLKVIDGRNPSNPIPLGTAKTLRNTAVAVAASGHFAFVSDYNSGVEIFDFSTPSAPRRVAYYESSPVNAITLQGGLAFLALGESGLDIVDITNPARPSRVGRFDTLGHTENAYPAGSLVYLADNSGGLHILDISNPSHPSRIGGNRSFYALDALVHRGQILVAASRDGVMVMDSFRSPGPRLTGLIAGEAFELTASGPLGQPLRIQRSSDLRTWEDWTSSVIAVPPETVRDQSISSHPRRFYRALQP